MCCSVSQCVAVCCSVLQLRNYHIRSRSKASGLLICMLQCVAVRCSVLQCVAVRCCVLQCVAVCCSALQCVAVHCKALQCVAVRCSVLQCVAACRNVLQCVARRIPDHHATHTHSHTHTLAYKYFVAQSFFFHYKTLFLLLIRGGS